jgi:hypothetical protein
MRLTTDDTEQSIMGSFDGITAGTGVALMASTISSHAVVITLLGLAIAEFFGMGGAKKLSGGNYRQAAVMSFASFLGCFWLAFPYIFAHGNAARIGALVMWLIAGLIIGKLRRGKNWQTYATTFAVLGSTAIATFFASKL